MSGKRNKTLMKDFRRLYFIHWKRFDALLLKALSINIKVTHFQVERFSRFWAYSFRDCLKLPKKNGKEAE